MIFRDREEAARKLAERLDHCRGRHPLVLAVGSVTEDGDVVVSPFAWEIGVTQEYIDREAADRLAEAHLGPPPTGR